MYELQNQRRAAVTIDPNVIDCKLGKITNKVYLNPWKPAVSENCEQSQEISSIHAD
jgi:hypothetical protein